MAEIIISWILGLIVIAIAWGVTDKLAVRIKTLVKSVQTLKRNKRLENMVAGLLALVALSIMVVAADDYNLGESVGLPALLIWAGGLWLIPFRVDAVGHYWFSSLAIAVILVLFWRVSASPSSIRAHSRTDVPTEQGQETSPTVTGLGFLFWIFLIGLTVAAIARYTSTWHAAVLNS
jgi:hypothetical protein